MKKIFLAILIVLLFVTSIGCAVDAPAAPAAQPFATVAVVDQKDATLKTEITGMINNEKSERTNMDTQIVNRVAALEGKSGGYTKEEINTKFNALISNLTDEQIALLKTKLGISSTNPSGSSNPSIPSTGKVSHSIWKEPGTPIYVAGSYTWWLKITNGFAEYKKIYVSINLGATGTIIGDVTVAGTYFYSPDLPVRPTDTSPSGKFSMSFVPTGGVDCSLISGNSQGYAIVKGNSEIVIPITLVLAYGADASQFTEIVFNITAMNYP